MSAHRGKADLSVRSADTRNWPWPDMRPLEPVPKNRLRSAWACREHDRRWNGASSLRLLIWVVHRRLRHTRLAAGQNLARRTLV